MPTLQEYLMAMGGGANTSQTIDANLAAAKQQRFVDAQQQQALAMASQQRALAEQERQRKEAAYQAVIANPTDRKAQTAWIALNPKDYEGAKLAFGNLDQDARRAESQHLAAVRGYAMAGDANATRTALQRRIDADKKVGLDTADDEQLLSYTDTPDGLKTIAGISGSLIAALHPEKYADTVKGLGEADARAATLPGELAKTGAETGLLTQQARKTGAEADATPRLADSQINLDAAKVRDLSSQIDTRASQLELDRDKLDSDVQIKLDTLRQSGTSLSPGSEKVMTDAVLSSSAARQLQNRAGDLAGRLETAKASGGVPASVTGALTAITGNASETTRLRREYLQLRGSQAVKNLPPGPASDKDIQLALKGFPSENASVDTLVSFLRGMEKIQGYAADSDQARADWIAANGNLGTAKYDLTVNGVRVPKGATFADYDKASIGRAQRESAGERSYLRFGQ